MRELCRALFASGEVEALRVAARAALAAARALAPRVDEDPRARTAALDAVCAGDELVRMERVARAASAGAEEERGGVGARARRPAATESTAGAMPLPPFQAEGGALEVCHRAAPPQ